jgi:flagellar biosynthesis GTPase FlhF
VSNKPTFVFEGKQYRVNDPKLEIPGIGIRTAAEIAVDKKSQKALIVAGLAGDSITCLDEDQESEDIAAVALKNPALRAILNESEDDEDKDLEEVLKAQAAAVEAAEQKAAEQKAAEKEAAKQKAAEQKAKEQKPVEQEPAEQKAAEADKK